MKVRVVGISLEFCKGLTLGEVFQHLESNSKTIIKHHDEYFYFVDIVNNYITGCILRFKSNKKSIATERDSAGDLKINKSELKSNQTSTEMSVFVINPDSLQGLFYDYSGSVSVSGMSFIWKKAHNEARTQKRRDLIKQYSRGGDFSVEKAREQAEIDLDGLFRLKALCTKGDLEALLKRYEVLKELEYTSDDLLEDAGRFVPQHNLLVKRGKMSFSFNEVFDPSEIKKYIKSVFPQTKRENEILRIRGLAHSGDEISQVVGENTIEFGRLEYDDYVDLLPSDLWKNYTSSDSLGKLLYRITQLQDTFGQSPNNIDWKLASKTRVSMFDLNKYEEE